jgi:acyl carrier protein
MEGVEEKIKNLFVKLFDVRPDEVTSEAILNDDLGMDSTEMVELTVALEKEFKIKIRDGEITNEHSVGSVLRIVENKLIPH